MPEEEQLPGIMKYPVPTGIAWEVVSMTDPDGEDHWFVALSFATPVGSSTYFLPPDNARALVDGISKALGGMPDDNPRAKLIVPDVDADAVMKAVINGGKRKGAGR